MGLNLTVENRLTLLQVQGDRLREIGGAITDMKKPEDFDYDDVDTLVDEAETALGQIRRIAGRLRDLKDEQRQTEGEPIGRRREEPA